MFLEPSAWLPLTLITTRSQVQALVGPYFLFAGDGLEIGTILGIVAVAAVGILAAIMFKRGGT